MKTQKTQTPFLYDSKRGVFQDNCSIHESKKLYLDRDETGNKFTKYALSISKYSVESGLYKHYKEMNEWLVDFGKDGSGKLGF